MKTYTYPTNLTDAKWSRLEPLFPVARTGHPRHHSLRTIVNALLYVLRTGCTWRLLPPDWPAWQAVYYYPSENGGVMAPWNASVRSCAKSCGSHWGVSTCVTVRSELVRVPAQLGQRRT